MTSVPTHAMSIEALKKQGWVIVDWDNKRRRPRTGDYIQEFEPSMGNKYSYKITAIGDMNFIARSTSDSRGPEGMFSKYSKVWVYKKAGTGHCLINGIGSDKENHKY